MTTVFTAVTDGKPVGSDDAAEAKIFAIDEIPWDELVFDHAQILKDFLMKKH